MSLTKPDNREKTIDQSLQIGIFQTDPVVDGNITFINEFGTKLFGFDSPDDVVGRKFKDVFVNHDSVSELINNVLQKKNTGSEFDIVCKRNDGIESLVGVIGALVEDSSGSAVRIDGTIRDKNSSEELERDIVTNVSKIIISNLYMKEVYKNICEELHRMIFWERVSILLKEGVKEGGGVVDFAVMTKGLKKGSVFDKFKEKSSHAMVGSIFEKVLLTKKPFIVHDTAEDDLETNKIFAKDGLRSRMAYPLTMKDKIIGCITFSAKPVDCFNKKHLGLLEKVAPFLSIAIENSKIYFKATKTEKEYNDLFKTIDSPWI